MATTLANISIKDSSSWNTYLNLIYPVGSYYLSNNSKSPSSQFGGTWTQIKDQRFLCGYTSITTGGANSVTLTVNQIPKHTHTTQFDKNANTLDASYGNWFYGGYSAPSNPWPTGSAGGGGNPTKIDPYSALVLCGTELLKLFTSKGGE